MTTIEKRANILAKKAKNLGYDFSVNFLHSYIVPFANKNIFTRWLLIAQAISLSN